MVKKLFAGILLALSLIVLPYQVFAARTDEGMWTQVSGYIKTVCNGGCDVLINGVNKYLNFGSVSGSSGYGIRDNGGTIECKDSGGAWSPCQDGVGGGGSGGGSGAWATSTDNVLTYLTTQWSALIGGTATTSEARLSVFGSTTVTGTGIFGGELRVPNIVATSSATSSFPVLYSSTSTVSNLNGVVYVDGVRFAKTGAGIQSAINYVCSRGGGRVHFPAGAYTADSASGPITLCSNITISGDGFSSVVTMTGLSNINMFENKNKTTGNENITIRDISLVKNPIATYPAGNPKEVFWGYGVSSSTIHNVHFSYGGVVLESNSTYVNTVNTLTNGNNKYNIVSNNVFDDTSLVCVVFSQASHSLATNNICHSYDSAFASLGAWDDIKYTNNIVYRNDTAGYCFENNHDTGLDKWDGLHISNNYCYGTSTKDGIIVYGGTEAERITNTVITGNTIASSSVYGIQVESVFDGIILSNNLISNSGRAGIAVISDISNSTSSNLIVNGNIIRDSGTTGIRPYGVFLWLTSANGNLANINITNNTVFNSTSSSPTTDSIRIITERTDHKASDVFISNNTVKNVSSSLTVSGLGTVTYGTSTNAGTQYLKYGLFGGDAYKTSGCDLKADVVSGLFYCGADSTYGLATSTPWASGQFVSVLNNGTVQGIATSTLALNGINFGVGTGTPLYPLVVVGSNPTAQLYGNIPSMLFSSTQSGTKQWKFAAGFNDSSSFSIIDGSSQRILIDGNGNVGFSTTTPYSRVSITAAGSGNEYALAVANSANGPVFNIQGNGRVGIGTTSPYAKLSVVGPVVAGYYVATSTATSTFRGVTADCFSYDGTNCLGTGGTTYTGTYPVVVSGSVISSALSTTTSQTWSGANMFRASTTIGDGTTAGGLTVTGGATTTSLRVGIPFASEQILGTGVINASGGIFSNSGFSIPGITTLAATSLYSAQSGFNLRGYDGAAQRAILEFANNSTTGLTAAFPRGASTSVITATSTLYASVFPYASTTALTATTLCLTGDTCRTTWPTAGGTSNVATSTYAWTIFKQGNNVVVWDNVRGELASTQTTLNAAFSQHIIQNATSTPTGKMSVFIAEGLYPVTATTTFTGNSSFLGSSEWVIRGAGASTTILLNANTSALNFIDQARVSLSDMSFAFSSVAPQSTAIFASSTSGTVQSSLRESSIDRIMFFSTTTGHTAYPIIDRSGFRNHFTNLDFFQTGGCIRTENWYTNAQFISGDTTYQRMFCEVNMSGVSAYKFEGVRGLINQNTLIDLDGIANHTNNTMYDFIGVSRTTVDQFNSEEFATTTSIRSVNSSIRGERNSFRTNKYLKPSNVTNAVIFYTDTNSLDNVFMSREIETNSATYLFMDRNTLVPTRANKFLPSDDGVILLSNIGAGSFLFATTTTSIVGAIYDNDTGLYSYLNRVKIAGNRIILDFMNGADTAIQWVANKIAFFMDGVEEMSLAATGLTVSDTVTATNLVATSSLTSASSTIGIFLGTYGTTTSLAVRSLVSCDTIDTDANGNFKCGSDATGGAGGVDYSKFSTSTVDSTSIYFNGTGKVGIGTSTPWAKLSVVSTDSTYPVFGLATSSDFTSIGFLAKALSTSIFKNNWWNVSIGGATSTARYALNGVTTFGRQNSDTMVVNIDPMTVSLQASLTANSVNTSIAPGALYVDSTDGNLSIVTMATTSHTYAAGLSVTNGCEDGGPWLNIRANEALGAAANEGGIVRGTGVFDLRNTRTGQPAAIAGGQFTASGTPVMEVTICTPTVSPLTASSTTLMPAQYGFGFGDTSVANAFFSSTVPGPANGAFIAASTTENWQLYNTNANIGVRTDTGISTTTTRTAPQTFRIAMTATATYAYLYDYNTGLWNSIGVNTTRQTQRDFSWFISVNKPGVAGVRHDFMFRNLKVWYSPTYRF